jgi:hypothetical protein
VADLDRLLAQAEQGTPRRCKMRDILSGLTDEQAAKVNRLPPTIAARVLSQAGMPVSDHTVRTHRDHDCG